MFDWIIFDYRLINWNEFRIFSENDRRMMSFRGIKIHRSRKKNIGHLMVLRPVCVPQNTFPLSTLFHSVSSTSACELYFRDLRRALVELITYSGTPFIRRDPCTKASVSDSLLNCYYPKRSYLYSIVVYLQLSSDYWRKRARSASSSQETLIKRAQLARKKVAFPISGVILKFFLDTLNRENNSVNSKQSLTTSYNFLIICALLSLNNISSLFSAPLFVSLTHWIYCIFLITILYIIFNNTSNQIFICIIVIFKNLCFTNLPKPSN